MRITWHGDVGEIFDWKVGDAFYDDDYPRSLISTLHTGKRPIIVILPGRVYFCVYTKQRRDGKDLEPGWAVSGEPNAITMQPSVNIEHIWHGFITNGDLQPDTAQVPVVVGEPPHIVHASIPNSERFPVKQITLKTTVGGQFDFEAVRKALHEVGPLEPEREYVLRLDLVGAPESAPVAEAPTPTPPSPRSSRSRAPAADAES